MATLPVLSFTPQDTDSMYGFCLSVSGDTVAVMFSAAHAEVETLPGPGQLVFWNWKTGQLLSVRATTVANESTYLGPHG